MDALSQAMRGSVHHIYSDYSCSSVMPSTIAISNTTEQKCSSASDTAFRLIVTQLRRLALLHRLRSIASVPLSCNLLYARARVILLRMGSQFVTDSSNSGSLFVEAANAERLRCFFGGLGNSKNKPKIWVVQVVGNTNSSIP